MELLKETFQKYSNERKKQARYSILNSVKVDGCNNKNSFFLSLSIVSLKKKRKASREREREFIYATSNHARKGWTNEYMTRGGEGKVVGKEHTRIPDVITNGNNNDTMASS